MARLTNAVAAAVLALVAQTAQSDELARKQKLLAGLSTIQLLIEDLPSAAAACGLDLRLISNAVMYPLSGSKIRVVLAPQVAVPTLYVRLTTVVVAQGQICSTAVRI